MATGNIANVDSTQSLLSLIGAVKGSSSSQTTTPNVSAAGMNQILQQILQQAPGITSQARGAGLYNSPTQQLLNNDFATRTAGELAKQQAGSTTTTKTAPKVSGGNILTLLGIGLGKSILGPTVGGIAKKSGFDQFGNKLADSLGVGSSGAGAVDSGGTNLFSGDSGGGGYSNVGGLADSLSDFGSSLSVDAGGLGIDAAGAGFSAAADTGLNSGSDLVSSAISDTAEEEGGSFLGSLFG